MSSSDHRDDQPCTPLAVAMGPDDLRAARESLESQGLWVLTHRRLVYSVTREAVADSLRRCSGGVRFVRLGEPARARLLRSLQDPRSNLGEVERCLRRSRVLGQLVGDLAPVGRLRCDLEGELLELATGQQEHREAWLCDAARRQLKRLLAAKEARASHGQDGNLVPFPLDSELSPDSLRREIHEHHQDPCRSETCKLATKKPAGSERRAKLNNDSNNNASSWRQLETDELYRPYLNDWIPFDVSTPPSTDNVTAESDELQRDLDSQMALARQRLLATVVTSLSWRQKQLRQQRLAVRLATRSALIGLKHSITVQPAKNYLELYVNMISRAVENASWHVRRWSHSLEQSWKTFREIPT